MGEWHCPGCRCELCGLSDFERVVPPSDATGSTPPAPCINGAAESSGVQEFGPRTMLLCDQWYATRVSSVLTFVLWTFLLLNPQ
jgi:hypothetical protein